MLPRRRGHDVCPEQGSQGGGDASLPLGAGEGVGYLDLENIGSEHMVDRLAKIIPQLIRLRRVRLWQHPLQCDVGIEDVDHSSSRPWRINSTAMSRTPCFSSNSCCAFRERSRTRWATSASTARPATAA